MMDKNPQARALAYKKCKGKIQKIAELGITPDMEPDAIEKLIEDLSVTKAAESGQELGDVVKGQRWYVENLVSFSALSIEDQFEHEYNDAFADSASETELLNSLRALAGK